MDSIQCFNEIPIQTPSPSSKEELVVENGVKPDSEVTLDEKVVDKNKLSAVLQFLKKHNLQETEAILRKEAKIFDNDKVSEIVPDGSDLSSILSIYKSEGSPDIYEENYCSLKKCMETALDSHKYELAMILYPVFVHMYLELVYNENEGQAQKFMEKFRNDQEDYYLDDVKKLSFITKKNHMKGNEFMESFKSGRFTVRMSRGSYNILKRHLQDKKNTVLQNIVQEHLCLDVYEGISRDKRQRDNTAGGLVGEASSQANNSKIYYGLLKDSETEIPLDEEEGSAEGDDQPKKKKAKKNPMLFKKPRNDPNAPHSNRIPLPKLRDADKVDKINSMRDATKRMDVGPDSLPSICFYTFLNSHQGVTCVEISEDSSLLSAGFSDSIIRVWSLTLNGLTAMKSAENLEFINKEAEDVMYRMMDVKNSTQMRTLIGHSGPVYSTSFSPDRKLLISCSEDTTIRLWGLEMWACLACYKGHFSPVWDVKFSSHGYYFASCGTDRTAKLWATSEIKPLRIFVGHVSDVDCLQFHPNSNYIATGSSDRAIRMWDVLDGNCVRVMTGHKEIIYNLAFSTCGRFLASAGSDKRILVWDITYGHLLADLNGHTDTIYALAFSREGTILASGGLDNCVKLWDFTRVLKEIDRGDIDSLQAPNFQPDADYLLNSFHTKSTPILKLHFTRRNLLLGAGMYLG